MTHCEGSSTVWAGARLPPGTSNVGLVAAGLLPAGSSVAGRLIKGARLTSMASEERRVPCLKVVPLRRILGPRPRAATRSRIVALTPASAAAACAHDARTAYDHDAARGLSKVDDLTHLHADAAGADEPAAPT